MNNSKKMLIYIKYPYTAIIITVMWICTIAMLKKFNGENLELILSLTAATTVYLAYRGFKPIK